MIKKIIYTITVLLVLSVVFYAGYMAHKPSNLAGTAAPVGTLNTIQRIASVNVVPLTTTATTTAIFNGDSTDRVIRADDLFCSGIAAQPAVNTFTLQAGTSSTAVVNNSNSNYAMNINIATTSAIVYVASSTYGSDIWRIWPTQTYMIFSFNATDTAACTVSVSYLSL